MTTDKPTLTPAEILAAKIARIEALRTENAADFRPSFVALLAASDWREAA